MLGRLVLVAVVVLGVWYVVGHYTGISRFGCQNSGAVAHADDSDCPASINAADEDAEWAAARLARIPRAGNTTTGLFYDIDGRAVLPRVLPAGATLVVWWRDDIGIMRSQMFTGGAQ